MEHPKSTMMVNLLLSERSTFDSSRVFIFFRARVLGHHVLCVNEMGELLEPARHSRIISQMTPFNMGKIGTGRNFYATILYYHPLKNHQCSSMITSYFGKTVWSNLCV